MVPVTVPVPVPVVVGVPVNADVPVPVPVGVPVPEGFQVLVVVAVPVVELVGVVVAVDVPVPVPVPVSALAGLSELPQAVTKPAVRTARVAATVGVFINFIAPPKLPILLEVCRLALEIVEPFEGKSRNFIHDDVRFCGRIGNQCVSEVNFMSFRGASENPATFRLASAASGRYAR